MSAKKIFFQYKVWVFCALACLIIPIFRPRFLSVHNISGMLTSMIPYGVVAIGLMFGLVAGIINLMIGSIMSLCAVVFALMIPRLGLAGALAVSLMAGGLVGLVAGWLVSYVQLNNWLVAISLMTTVKGIAVYISNQDTVRISHELFDQISSASLGPVPVLFFAYLLLVLAVDFFLFKTQMGRNLFAVGGSREIAAACGLNARRYGLFALVMSSVIAGFGGILLTTRVYSANGNMGTDAIMSCLPMVIMGGATFTGGKGSAIGTVSGCLVMVLITTFMNLFNIYINVQTLIQGIILLVIIVSDKYFVNRKIKV